MLFQESNIKEREDSFYKNLIRLYLKYGSVDKVFEATNYDLPISYPGMHHLIRRWGIVKSSGPNSLLSEAITLVTMLSEKKISVERLYKILPPSIATSFSTMYRILHNVKEGVIRRYGTALVITPEGDTNKILVAKESLCINPVLGKRTGSVTLPMTYSGKDEDPKISILRVLQQEVFTQQAIEKKMPDVIPDLITPFMRLQIADIGVDVYHLQIPNRVLEKIPFSSEKVDSHAFLNQAQILALEKGSIRSGVNEIILGFSEYLQGRNVENLISDVNLALSPVH